jgi:AraC-like DNA-binding protein
LEPIKLRLEDIEYLSELISKISALHVCLISRDGIELYKLCDQYPFNPLQDYHGFLYAQALSNVTRDQLAIIKTSLFGNFLCVRIRLTNNKIGFLFAGPSIAQNHAVFAAEAAGNGSPSSGKGTKTPEEHLKYLPMLSDSRLMAIGALVLYSLGHQKVEPEANRSLSRSVEKAVVDGKFENEYELSLAENRVVGYLHRSPYYERQLCRYIREGNAQMLSKFLSNNRLYADLVTLSKANPLRSRKNLVICLITLASRAAVEGGLRTELAYALSDIYIQRLEEINNIKDISGLSEKVYFDFTERVYKIKSQSLSRIVMLCQSYIHKHLNENIRVSYVAQLLKVNSNYLSGLFKKEMGMTISEYILGEKIKEAKHMLAYTNHPILEIYSSLNFCDQSHFTKMFKKNTGMTPKQYRKNDTRPAIWKEP